MTRAATFAAPLPIDAVLPEVRAALERAGRAVVEAPPGAGKTTRLPLAILDLYPKGRIVMLEPRRIAARASARRMAAEWGEAVGETIGYRVRNDARVSDRTRIEIVTEGIFLRQIQSDPALEGVVCVIFDEFHERSLDADLALALTLEARALRPDLHLIVMSATLDAAPVAQLLDDAPRVTSQGRAYSVDIRWMDRPAPEEFLSAMTRAIARAWAEESGSILAFLPGQGEIRRLAQQLEDMKWPGARIAPLFGDMSPEAQDAAIRPAPAGERKIVLATSIAETSLTIEGVRIVVDGGLARGPRFDPATGMTGLTTGRVSQAQAEQRRGRAGRLEPGVCYRLWSEADHRGLPPYARPEILDADLGGFALEIAAWGARIDDLRLLDAPPAAHWQRAVDLLRQLEALDDAGRITDEGRRMNALGLHPRLAHMLVRGTRMGLGPLACDMAAILSDRDLVRGARQADLEARLRALRQDKGGAAHDARQTAQSFRRLMNLPKDADARAADDAQMGALVALAYPERVAMRRGPRGQFRMASGRGATLDAADILAGEEYLAIADLDGAGANARIHRAARLDRATLGDVFAARIERRAVVEWDTRAECVIAREEERLGALVLSEKKIDAGDAALPAMIAGLRAMGLVALPWDDAAQNLRARVAFLRAARPDEDWPDWSDAAIEADYENWLAPHLTGVTRRAHLTRLDLYAILRAQLDWPRQQALDRLAPTHLDAPSGSRIALDYSGVEPVMAVRLQELFGLMETPRINDGRTPLLLHLLSPARRPVQVTRDLASFWANGYPMVKKDLKGQYPKHYWPDDPRQAEPTARAKPRR